MKRIKEVPGKDNRIKRIISNKIGIVERYAYDQKNVGITEIDFAQNQKIMKKKVFISNRKLILPF